MRRSVLLINHFSKSLPCNTGWSSSFLNSRGSNVRCVWQKRRVIPGDNPLEYLKSLADSLMLRFEEFVENGVSQSIRRKTDDVIELLEVVGRYFHRCPVFKIKGIH